MRLTKNIDGVDRYFEPPDGADSTIAVLKDAGWVEADELVQVNPALAPGEEETVPAKPARKTSKTTDTSTDE
jgi:hypothetical protein